MIRKTFAVCILVLCFSGTTHAQEPPMDPIEFHTFTPELVMQHQSAIHLSEQQAEAIKHEVVEAQARFTDLEWDLQSRMETFLSLLKEDRVDEELALSHLQEVLELESAIKKIHLTLAIRIKNQLSPEQQRMLHEFRDRR